MNRHGVVVPREDGVRARCLGPGGCSECDKDMADLPFSIQLDYLTAEVARRWSVPNADLRTIIAWVMRCVIDSRAPVDNVSSPVTVSVPLLDIPQELQLMTALQYICQRYTQPDELARATAWLANKYAKEEPCDTN